MSENSTKLSIMIQDVIKIYVRKGYGLMKEESEKEVITKDSSKITTEKKQSEKPSDKKSLIKKTQVKKAEIKEDIHIEFSGKSYSKEDLIKSVKDIWKYDYKKKAMDINSINLYVKPEEGKAYYVINGEVLGDFIV